MADKADEEADKVLNMKGEYHPNWHQVRDEIFAKLVAEREREACAAICDELHKARVGKDNYFAFAANAIRELRAKQ